MAFEPVRDRGALALALRSAGQGRVVVSTEELAPWPVTRVRLEPGEPETVVAKWLRQDPLGTRGDPAQLLTERAALAFLEEYCPGIAPDLLGASDGVLVLQDLHPRRPLLELIASDDPGWPAGLDRFARTIGRLHVDTVGRAGDYYGRRARLGPVDRGRELLRFCEPRPDLDELSRRLDAPIGAPTSVDLRRATAELESPGAFLAFSNGDSGANNFLVDGDDGRLIDFEFAGFRHCLSDLCCLYVPGPQWLTVGDPAADGTEQAYRSVLADAVPEIEDDRRFGAGLAAAGLLWALVRAGRLGRLDARAPGHESRTQLVSTLDAAARTAERFGQFPALTGWVRTLEERLRRRWPDTDVDLTDFAPYSRRE